MRIIFMGTPDFAVPTLNALYGSGSSADHKIVAVYTQPPRPSGRGKMRQPSAVHKRAEQLGLEVRHPLSLKSAITHEEFAAYTADIAVVAAYGLILPQIILDTPPHGCINVHASLLPRWRGAAPIHRAIMAGDRTTGVTIMRMEAGLDTGPMIAAIRTPIEDKTTGELTAELAELGGQLLVETLRQLPRHTPEPQDNSLATHAAKIDKAEARIVWSNDADRIERTIRALAPFPGAWFEMHGERIKILKAEWVAASGQPGKIMDDILTIGCGQGAIRPISIQRAGRPKMETADFLRGLAIPVGTVLA